jgi:diadenosine tetraphosphate (Ap4A) HIT family hydrolase
MRAAAALLPLLVASAAPQSTGDDGYGHPYPADEIFAKIARHAAPAYVVYEDADTMAFLDISPFTPGHVLVIARTSKARSLIDTSPELLARMMATARRVMQAQRKALGAEGALILISNGNTQAVPHLHIHVIPTLPGKRSWSMEGDHPRAPDAALKDMAAKLAEAMPAPAR